jgi:hypothetical protein
MRISAAQRTENENRIRAAMDRLLRGEMPPGGKCDIKTLANEAGVDRTAFYGTRPYAHLRVEFERRVQALQDAGEIPDPREAQITRLKAETTKLRERLAQSEQMVEELTDFRGPCPGPARCPARRNHPAPRSRRRHHSGQPPAATPNHRHWDVQLVPHTRPDASSRMARVGPHQQSDRRLVGQRRYGARTEDHERVFRGRHHGKGEPVELKTECDVIRMDSLTHTLRQLGGGARRGSAAEELSSIRPSLGSSSSDVLSARQIFIGLPILASDYERDTVTLACPQELSRCLRHHEAGTQHQRRLLDRKGADCPCRGFLHNGPSAKVNRPQQARRVDGVEPGRGRTVFERHPIRVASLERQGFIQRLGKNDLFRPLGKGPGSHGESTHDVDHHRHGRSFDQISDTKEASVHTGHDRACPNRGTQRVIRITSMISKRNTSGCLHRESSPQRHACSIATQGDPHTVSAGTRHTVAWFIYRQPGGRIALGLQYGHVGRTLAAAYGGRTKQDMLKVLVAAERRRQCRTGEGRQRGRE